MSDMKTNAVLLHEMMLSYIEAGFTRAEAIDLIKTELAALTGKSK